MAARSNSKKKMSKEDSIYWDKLYQYVKKDIYKLDDDVPLPRSIILSFILHLFTVEIRLIMR